MSLNTGIYGVLGKNFRMLFEKLTLIINRTCNSLSARDEGWVKLRGGVWLAMLLFVCGLGQTVQAQTSNVVYGAEYNLTTNRFGTINLLNGVFTQMSSLGSMVVNDVAYCPTNGKLYGISNSTALISFNLTNGSLTKIANFSVSGIESLAFRQSDGALFGCTQSRLYSINPATAAATSLGSFGSATNLGSTAQNIRFAKDGNLYIRAIPITTIPIFTGLILPVGRPPGWGRRWGIRT